MIQLKDVSFHYADSKEGVSSINLTVKEGECIVLTGPSGGGKTTIARLINGLAPSYYAGILSGSITLNNKDLSQMEQFIIAKQVGSIFQDPKSQFFSSELAGEVAFACENYGFSAEEIRTRTDNAITSLTLDKLRTRNLDELSSGEKQKVAIASVYALSPKIYVCDEPTANLDKKGTEELALILKQLKEAGYTIIVAEHRLSWLIGIADRFVYIRNGKIMWERSTEKMQKLSKEEIEAYGLREISEKKERNFSVPLPYEPPFSGLCVKQLCCKRKKDEIFTNISFTAQEGHVTAITGHNGIGKTSLALVLAGLWKENKGEVYINGKRARGRERRKQIWYSSNDAETQIFTNSVSEEVLLNLKRSEAKIEKARDLLKRLGLYQYKDVHPAALSGGQKQRLAIACGLLSDRRILIFDEPTSGLDGGNMKIIADVLREAAEQDKVIIVITHDDELLCYCDNVITLK